MLRWFLYDNVMEDGNPIYLYLNMDENADWFISYDLPCLSLISSCVLKRSCIARVFIPGWKINSFFLNLEHRTTVPITHKFLEKRVCILAGRVYSASPIFHGRAWFVWVSASVFPIKLASTRRPKIQASLDLPQEGVHLNIWTRL